MIYKTFQKVSNVCQLLDKSKYHATQTIAGVTVTNNGDGTITANGNCTYTLNINLTETNKFTIKAKHKYLILDSSGSTSRTQYSTWVRSGGGAILLDSTSMPIGGITYNDNKCTVFLRFNNGVSVSNIVFKPQLFDLTEMYGAGHEPTTVAQFRQDFPEEMYDYSPHCFVKSYKTLLKASDVCQLLDKSKYPATKTNNGVTFTNNGDGTITANGTSTKDFAEYHISRIPKPPIGHKILVLPSTNPTIQNHIYIYAGNTNGVWIDDLGHGGRIITITEITSGLKKTYTTINISINVNKGWTMNNHIYKPQLFDLTEMYGAGNEPITVEQFRQDFPEELYDYKPYSTIPSYKKSLVCKTKNLLPYPYYDSTKTANGITFTDNGDGTINLSGTSTKQANYYFSYGTLNLKKGVTYTLSASGDYSCSGSFSFYIYNSTYGSVCYIPLKSSNSASVTPTQDINGINCYIVVPADRTVSGTLKPMLELGSTATDYVPYGHL